MKQSVLDIRLKHILGEEEYNNMIIEEERMPAEEQTQFYRKPTTYIHTPQAQEPHRKDQQNLKPPQEIYKEKLAQKDTSFHIEMTRPRYRIYTLQSNRASKFGRKHIKFREFSSSKLE